MVYKNYLTTPRGRYCELSEIRNSDYLILIKYIQGENYQKFFECLDELVKIDLPDFDSFDIVEKCYVYLAYCMYSIRGSITVKNTMIGDQEIQMSLILNNIEKGYIPNNIIDYRLNESFVLQFGYPTSFFFEDGNPVIDYYSGLIGCNGEIITNEQKEILKQKLGTKQLSFIDSYLRENFTNDCDIFYEVPMNRMVINLLSEVLIGNIVGFYKMPLDAFYRVMYAMVKHLRMSYSDFMNISQVETNILLSCAAEENKKIEESSKKGDITTIGRALSDAE